MEYFFFLKENLKIREDRIKGIYIENAYEIYVSND